VRSSICSPVDFILDKEEISGHQHCVTTVWTHLAHTKSTEERARLTFPIRHLRHTSHRITHRFCHRTRRVTERQVLHGNRVWFGWKHKGESAIQV
jgi:hypothetical protein